MAETMTLQGGCLCGRIRYEVRPESDEGYYCHCRMCQLAFGNTRAAFINVPQAALRWLTEEPKLYASSKFARRGFCPDCGTRICTEWKGGGEHIMGFGLATLDYPQALKPRFHMWTSSKLDWVSIDDGLPQFETEP